MKEFLIQTNASNEVAIFTVNQLHHYLGLTHHAGDVPEAIMLSLVANDTALSHVPDIYDGFRFRLSGGVLSLEAVQPRGLLNAAYRLLDVLGFHFPYPAQERYPAQANWQALRTLGKLETWDIPSFRHRILHFDNMRLSVEMIDWIGKLGINMVQIPLHVFRKDMGIRPELSVAIRQRDIELNVGCHGFDNWLLPTQYGREHPEWYSQSHAARQGVLIDPDDSLTPSEFSGGQICLSNPDVIREYSANVVRFLEKFPYVRTVSLWPNDGIGGWCTCANCLALESDPNRLDSQTGTPSRSASYMRFVRSVGEIVFSQVPDARIDFAGFYDFAAPPKEDVIPDDERYLGFLVDDYFGCLLHGHGEHWNRHRIEEDHCEWRTRFPHEIYAVGYYADLCKVMDFPIVFANKMAEDFRYLHDEIRIESVATLVVGAQLDYLLERCFQNLYSFAKLSWNHRQKPDDILRKLAGEISSSASEELYIYFTELNNIGINNPDKHAGWIWLEREKSNLGDWSSLAIQLEIKELLTPKSFATIRRSFHAAVKKVHGGDSVERTVLDAMLRAFRMLELMLEYAPDLDASLQFELVEEMTHAADRRGPFPAAIKPLLNRLASSAVPTKSLR